MENVHCIYHANCTDGFTAAWVVSQRYPNAVLHAAAYGQPVPIIPKDAVVYIVDFSYDLHELVALAQVCKSVHVLDHHISAVRKLKDKVAESHDVFQLPDNLELYLDIERSGARLAWDYFFPREDELPDLVRYVEDRDLWKFKYEDNTRNYVRALMARPFSIDAYTEVHETKTQKILDEGEVLTTSDERHIEWHLQEATRMVTFEGVKTPLVNAPKYLVSEITHRLVKEHPIVLAYHDSPDGRVFRVTTDSERSGFDASRIAEQYGGGGHTDAAGFIVPSNHTLHQL